MSDRYAFPKAALDPWGNSCSVNSGMELRDYFAAKGMQGMLACGVEMGPDDVSSIAESAYILADAMLEARKK